MKEIRIASANALYRIDAYITDIEKEYKCIIQRQLIDMKKNLIDIINLEKQAENAIKK